MDKVLIDMIKHGVLVLDSENLPKLGNEKIGHLHYRALPLLKDMVQRHLDLSIEKIRM
jgi:hypothetical protein